MIIGTACFFIPLITLATANVPQEKIASASGLFNFLRQLSLSFGTNLGTTIWDHRASFHDHRLNADVTIYNPAMTDWLRHIQSLGFSAGQAQTSLDRALDRAGLDRSLAYVTNAVKHFKWESLGKRRLHKKPTAREVAACRPWLLTELQLVQPRVVVTLGATATASLLGREFRVTANRGKFCESEYAPSILVTVHPSAILRSQKEKTRELDFERFVQDLREVTKLLRHEAAGRRSNPPAKRRL